MFLFVQGAFKRFVTAINQSTEICTGWHHKK